VTFSDVEGFETFLSPIPQKIQHVLFYCTFAQQSVACNFNYHWEKQSTFQGQSQSRTL